MARTLTIEELQESGLTKKEAEAVLEMQNTPKPRRIYWMFQATYEEAAAVAEQHPEFEFEKRYKGSSDSDS